MVKSIQYSNCKETEEANYTKPGEKEPMGRLLSLQRKVFNLCSRDIASKKKKKRKFRVELVKEINWPGRVNYNPYSKTVLLRFIYQLSYSHIQ